MKAEQFSDSTLAKAFRLLYGETWHRGWTVTDMADEMRSIIRGTTKPCIAFENWGKCYVFLEEQSRVEKPSIDKTKRILADISGQVEKYFYDNRVNGWISDTHPIDMGSDTMYLTYYVRTGLRLGVEFPHLYQPEALKDYKIVIWRAKKDYSPGRAYASVTITNMKTAQDVIREVGVILSKLKP